MKNIGLAERSINKSIMEIAAVADKREREVLKHLALVKSTQKQPMLRSYLQEQ